MSLPATMLGITIACFDGPDAQFRIAQTDEEILRDEVYHRLTTDSVVGDSPEAKNFGHDVRRYAGARLSATAEAELGPTLSATLQQSGRVEYADVTVTSERPSPDLLHLTFSVTVRARHPVTGDVGDSFVFLFLLTPDTFEQIGAPA